MTQTVTPSGLKTVEKAIHEHHALVYRLAHRMLRNSADAEDVTQCVFLLLLRSLESFRKARSARAWLARVTVNQAVSWIRAEGRRRKREQSWAADPMRPRTTGDTMNNDSPNDTMPDSNALKTAIQELPEELRVPLILHYQEGFKYREIAETCKCPEGTVAKRISTAKARIKRQLAKGGALLGALSLDGVLRAEAPISMPPGLAEKLIDGASRELARLGATTAAAAGAASLPIGKTLLAKVAVALSCALLVMTGAWYGVERVFEPRRASDSTQVTSSVPAVAPGRSLASRQGTVSRPAAREKLASTEASVDSEAADPATAEGEARRGPQVRGWVRDSSGVPLAGARMSFASSAVGGAIGNSVETDEAGYYELDWDKANPDPQAKVFGGIPVLERLGDVNSAQLAAKNELDLFESRLVYSESLLATTTLINEVRVRDRIAADFEVANQRLWKSVDLVVKAPQEGDASEMEAASLGWQLRAFQVENDELATKQASKALQYRARLEGTAKSALTLTSETSRCASCHQGSAPAASSAAFVKASDASPRADVASPSCAAKGQTVVVRAELEGFEPQSSEPIDLVSTDSSEASFTLRGSKPIAGIVTTDRGAPVPEAEVAVVAYSRDDRLPPETLVTRTGEDGRFAFSSLGRGLFLIRAHAEGFLSAEAVIRVGAEGVQLVLETSARVSVTVVAGETGEPLPGYKVELHDSLSVAAEAVTDAAGSALLHGLRGGPFVLNTYKDDSSSKYSRATQEVFVTQGKESTARLVVHSRSDVLGSVTGIGYDGVLSGAIVQIVPHDPVKRSSSEMKSSSVLADGSFSVKNVPPGSYALIFGRARPDGEMEPWKLQELDVRPGEKQTLVDVHLESSAPGTLELIVEDALGRPVVGAKVALSLAGLDLRLSTRATDGDGRVAMECRPGCFSARVSAQGFERQVLASLTLRGADRVTQRVVLTRAEAAGSAQPSIAAIFSGKDEITVERPLSLLGFRELARMLGLGTVSIAPELEESGAADRVRTGDVGSKPACAVLEELLRSGGLTWKPSPGGLSVHVGD